MPDEDLKKRIEKEIQKTGFPLELRVADFLTTQGYYVANNVYFTDKDEKKGRELDLRALKNMTFEKDKEKKYWVRNCFLIECKKSEKPWVIFTSPETIYDTFKIGSICSGADPISLSVGLKMAGQLDKFNECNPLISQQRLGRTYFTPFRNSEDASTIFEALTKSVKATVAMIDDDFGAGIDNICFYYPIIVFEGKLFESYLQEGSIQLAEVDSIVVSFFYKSPNYENENYSVSIITEKALSSFCTNVDQVLNCYYEVVKADKELFKFNRKS